MNKITARSVGVDGSGAPVTMGRGVSGGVA
jgi:hypothetical protein